MNDALKRIKDARRYGKGTSEAANRRRAERTRGTVLGGNRGDVVKDSHGKQYAVAPDGSLRRLATV